MLKKFKQSLEEPTSFAIRVNNLSKSFNFSYERSYTFFESFFNYIKRKKITSKRLHVLNNISFEVKKGEVLGIVGRNGAGKSTLLKLLCRILYPDSGNIEIHGKISAFLELGTGFNPNFNAEENIILYGTLLRLSRKEMIKKMDDILEFAELKKFRKMKLRNFSSGMFLRLAFATAINVNPDILIIDEVLAVGDENFQKKCNVEIEKFKNEGKTIIIVTHSLAFIQKFCNRAILLENGQIMADGDVDFTIQKYIALLSKVQNLDLIQEKKVQIAYQRGGNAEATIERIRIFDSDNEELSPHGGDVIIKSGSTITIQLEVKFNKNIERPVFGLVIRNLNGVYIYGINNLWTDQLNYSFKKGDFVLVKFKMNIFLNFGTYTITPAVGYNEGQIVCDWIENARIFHVRTKFHYGGITDLQ